MPLQVVALDGRYDQPCELVERGCVLRPVGEALYVQCEGKVPHAGKVEDLIQRGNSGRFHWLLLSEERILQRAAVPLSYLGESDFANHFAAAGGSADAGIE